LFDHQTYRTRFNLKFLKLVQEMKAKYAAERDAKAAKEAAAILENPLLR
jgi:hypothetical protein